MKMANSLALAVHVLVFMTAAGQQSNVIVKIGKATTLQCDIPDTATTVTWRVNGKTAKDLSTCTIASLTCVDAPAAEYTASVSTNKKVFSLSVPSARINETVFTCSADSGPVISTSTLEVYAWPTKPTCKQSINVVAGSSSYIEYNCTTDNVYPNVSAVLRRKVTDFTSSDFYPNFPKCVNGGSGTDGGFAFSCQWRIPLSNFINGYNVYVEMSAKISDLTSVNETAVVSNDTRASYAVPTVRVIKCPDGPGVIGDFIRIGTQANCTCELTSQGFPAGAADWRTPEGKYVGVQTIGGSSILMLSYNASDPSPTYQCWPIPPFRANVTYYTITAKFTSSAPPSGITGLQVVVIALGVLSSLITSHVP